MRSGALAQGPRPALAEIVGNADWVNQDTLGVVDSPSVWGVPNAHGLGISSSTKYPDEAIRLPQDRDQRQMADGDGRHLHQADL
jgi:hypothetical protein